MYLNDNYSYIERFLNSITYSFCFNSLTNDARRHDANTVIIGSSEPEKRTVMHCVFTDKLYLKDMNDFGSKTFVVYALAPSILYGKHVLNEIL